MLIMQTYHALAPLAYDMFNDGPGKQRERLFREFYTIFARCNFVLSPDSVDLTLGRDNAIAELVVSGPGTLLLPALGQLKRQHLKPVEPFEGLKVPPSYIGGQVTIITEDAVTLTIPMLPQLPSFAEKILEICRQDMRSYLLRGRRPWDIAEERLVLEELRTSILE